MCGYPDTSGLVGVQPALPTVAHLQSQVEELGSGSLVKMSVAGTQDPGECVRTTRESSSSFFEVEGLMYTALVSGEGRAKEKEKKCT